MGADLTNHVEVLGNVFPGVAPELLETMVSHAKIREYDDGALICRQGAWEDTFHVLLHGQVNVWIYDVGEPVLVAFIPEGEPIGEIELLMDSPRNADVIAAGPAEVLELAYDDIALDAHPELFQALARTVISRLLTVQRQRVHDVAESLRRSERLDQLFVSYSSNEGLFAKKLATDLKHHRVSVWLDQFDIDPGKSWSRQIGEALDQCQIMLVIMSPDSMESGNTEDEWNYYLDQGKTIIPIRKEPCHVPYRLNKLQYIDFAEQPYEQALARLVAIINNYYADMADGSATSDLDSPATPTQTKTKKTARTLPEERAATKKRAAPKKRAATKKAAPKKRAATKKAAPKKRAATKKAATKKRAATKKKAAPNKRAAAKRGPAKTTATKRTGKPTGRGTKTAKEAAGRRTG